MPLSASRHGHSWFTPTQDQVQGPVLGPHRDHAPLGSKRTAADSSGHWQSPTPQASSASRGGIAGRTTTRLSLGQRKSPGVGPRRDGRPGAPAVTNGQRRFRGTAGRRLSRQQQRQQLQARRLRAAELFATGVRQSEVARQLGVSAEEVSVWHARWEHGSSDALRSRGPSGPAVGCSAARAAGPTRGSCRATGRRLRRAQRASAGVPESGFRGTRATA
jgi:Helix-turn-helix domain